MLCYSTQHEERIVTRGKTKREPTARGAKILRILELHKFSSVAEAARKANVHDGTLRRWIYSEPTGIDGETLTRLEGIGIPRELLLP
jgi:hypothetical protein